MNLMTLLIPFLLMSIQFVTLAVIDSSLPAIGQPQPQTEPQTFYPQTHRLLTRRKNIS